MSTVTAWAVRHIVFEYPAGDEFDSKGWTMRAQTDQERDVGQNALHRILVKAIKVVIDFSKLIFKEPIFPRNQ
jgi:hypothetical protein